ncbi:family 43 glycosylhydrolase [Micromonospora cremea]|uniref:Glycosyl hydrolases family 43 n=1 Tax=Micromonospora cremea TaxID=709881 RepID=A0A1N5U360_9ACTN|nr:family 43 glycosylhydrolase [Micromonospora cremea]SIM54777.1 Glycosyl hydrolases family 43 [Micromonospora cremea]
MSLSHSSRARQPARYRVRPLLAGLTALATSLVGLVALSSPGMAANLDDGLVLRYDLTQASGTTVTDSSGRGHNGSLSGDATWQGADGLRLGGTNGHVRLPDNVMQGLTDITVSVQVNMATDQLAPYFIWGLGNTLNGVGNGYLFTTGNALRASIASGNWSTEQTINTGRNLSRGSWRTITYTLGGGTAALYEDGVEVARQTGITLTPGSIGGGTTRANYLGRSVYTADRYLKGQVRDFRIYDRAVTADEAHALGEQTAAGRATADAAALDLGDTSAVTENLSLPTRAAGGSAVSWSSSNPAVVSSTGVVTRPAAGSGNATVTLTATVSYAGYTASRNFAVTVVQDITDQEKVDNALAAVVIHDQNAIRGNITLPIKGARDVAFTWTAKDPDVVTKTGEISRPPYGSRAVKARLSVRATKGSASAVRNFTLTVLPLPKEQPLEGYAFAYFTGEGTADGEQIYFAASRGNDPLKYDELNGGRPVLTSNEGDEGVRDPFIIRSPEGDKFYLIATDLKINGNGDWDASQRTGSKYIEVWESTDLVNWSQQRHVRVAPDTAGNTWAPEAYYDDTIGAYVVFWASKLYAPEDTAHAGNTYNRMLYATTRDFRTFSEPNVWVDPGYSVIDSTVVKHNGTYYRFTKDERNNTSSTPCSKFVLEEKSTQLRSTNWDFVKDCIGKATDTSAGINQGEGPTIFKSNTEDKWYVFIDEFGGRGYVPFETTDLDGGQFTMSTGYDLPTHPRHGTVLPVSKAELERLRQGPPPVPATKKGVIADYRLAGGTGTTVVDSSGNGRDATIRGGVTRGSDAMTFGGTDGYVDLPDNLLTGLTNVSVSAQVWVDPAQSTPNFIWGLGNTTDGAGNGYLFTTGNSYRTAIASGNWTTEQNTDAGRDLGRGGWHTITYTLSGGVARLYDNGVEVAKNSGVTTKPGDLGGGITTANYLGRSLYTGDNNFKGRMRSFTLWNRGLSANDVLSLAGNETAIGSVKLDALKTAAIINGDTNTVTLPVKPGTDVTALAPVFGISDGARLAPGNGSTQDLTKPVTYTVTGANGTSRAWTVKAVVMNSPVLPGYNADPNIVRFGDTYYIYATTDGFPGWSSTTFKTWSSKDLVHWTEHPTILDLGPDVSWADGRAWAPAAIEKNGKYYLYFCADAKIGVAVADSPTGPFVDALGKPLVAANPDGGQAIDPAVFTDDDGQSYLYWGNGNAYVVPLNPDMTSFDSTKVKRITGLTGFREGLFMAKRGGTYYLSWSIDDTGSENYRVGYATATSPMAGGLVNRGEILTKDGTLGILGTGHHSMIQVPGTDDWYIAYHRFAIPGGNGTHREVTIDRLRFNADGTIAKVVPTLESVPPLTH